MTLLFPGSNPGSPVMREYRSGDRIRLIHVNAAGSIPASRIYLEGEEVNKILNVNSAHIGDKVRIISTCNTKGRTGVITKIFYISVYPYVVVRLQNGTKRRYNISSVEKISEREDDKMTRLMDVANNL